MKTYTAYRRVSTVRQGQSGLGLEAQDAAMAAYVASVGGAIVATFEDIESGAADDRAGLAAALAHAKSTRSTILCARLDRLSRDVFMVARLQRERVPFICADMPEADISMVQVKAVFGEHERRMISARTRAALQAAKARGVKLGNPHLANGDATRAGNAAKAAKARAHAEMVAPYLAAARKAGAVTLRDLAAALTARGIATPSGAVTAWSPMAISRVLAAAA